MPSVECPQCGEHFAVVTPIDTRSNHEHSHSNKRDSTSQLQASVASWRELEPRHPYTGGTSMSQAEIERRIQRLETTIDVNGERFEFEFFQKTEDDSHFWTHVVRATTDAGRKSKDVVVTDDGELYLKNRGIPWNEDKSWTYLSESQLRERSKIAGLGAIIEVPDTRGGLGVLLDERYRPFILDGYLQEELVCKLAKALLVFQSESNPVA